MKDYLPNVFFNKNNFENFYSNFSIPLSSQDDKSIICNLAYHQLFYSNNDKEFSLTYFEYAALCFMYKSLDELDSYKKSLLEGLRKEKIKFKNIVFNEAYLNVATELLVEPITGIRMFQFGNYISKFLSTLLFKNINTEHKKSFLVEAKSNNRTLQNHFYNALDRCERFHSDMSKKEFLFISQAFKNEFRQNSTYGRQLLLGLEFLENPHLYNEKLGVYSKFIYEIIRNGMQQKIEKNISKGPNL
ncbi:hypothetical protein [Mesonia maritima]|uniref:Uncharacterized protein n=1 Tax=Mesonia maritima TaxID=1793873 RepID=A0ABU1KAJ2_9FLAO|nr:hypothetical protein [Mesonia maritima]MDR6302275.1 hypothetical protein [Mesonia maritima]